MVEARRVVMCGNALLKRCRESEPRPVERWDGEQKKAKMTIVMESEEAG